MLLDALLHSPILVQAFSNRSAGKGLADAESVNPNLVSVPFPTDHDAAKDVGACLTHLKDVIDIKH